jgi:hypothetical protein
MYWWFHLKYRDLQCDIHMMWLQEPVKIENSKYFSWCCCKSGPLTLVTHLPARGYVPGQSIPITIEVDNASKITISGIVCELIQVGLISTFIYLFVYLFILIIYLFVCVDSSLFFVVWIIVIVYLNTSITEIKGWQWDYVCLTCREVENKHSTDSLWYTETAFLMVICVWFHQNTAQFNTLNRS